MTGDDDNALKRSGPRVQAPALKGRAKAAGLGLLTTLPMLLAWFGSLLQKLHRTQPQTVTASVLVQGLVASTVLAVLLLVSLLVWYLVHVARNPRIAPGSKRRWYLALFFFNSIAMLFYWYRFFWDVPDEPSRKTAKGTRSR